MPFPLAVLLQFGRRWPILRTVEDVIDRARQGDPDALGQLWRTYQHLLLRYFRGKRMADPEDLTSVVWIEVATGLDRFEGNEHDFRRWLFTIASRRRIDSIRSTKRRHERDERQRPSLSALSSPSAGEDAEREQSLARALDLVSTLPSDQREAVMLRIIADLDVADVAAIMNKREGAVRVLVHRGLKRLAEQTRRNPAPDVTEPAPRTMYST